MVGVLVRLRWTISRQARGASTSARIWFAAKWLVALVVGGLLGAGIATLIKQLPVELSEPWLVVFTLIVGMLWVTLPVLVPALSSQIVDPGLLQPYGIPARTQVLGLLAGALVMLGALFLMTIGIGATVGIALHGTSVLSVMLAAVSAVVFTVTCVGASATAQTLLSDALGSRRGRDVALVLSGLASVGMMLATQRLTNSSEPNLAIQDNFVVRLLGWIPPSSMGAIWGELADGSVFSAAARLAVWVAVFVGAMWVWERSIARRPLKAGSGGTRRITGGSRLMPVGLAVFGEGRATAAAGQQWRYLFFRSAAAVRAIIVPIVAVVALLLLGPLRNMGVPLPLLAIFITAMLVGATRMALDFDARGFEYLVSTGTPWRPVLLGKVMASLPMVVVVGAVLLAVVALLSDAMPELPAALLMALCTLLTAIGVGGLGSVVNATNRAHITGLMGNRPPGKRVLGEFVLVFIPMIFLGLGYLARSWIAPGASDIMLALIMLPVAAVIAVAGLNAGARRLERDPRKVLEQLGV